MRVSYKNRCFEVTEAWIVDGHFRFKIANGTEFAIELEDKCNYRDDPINVLCGNGYVRLEEFAKRTTTVAELEVFSPFKRKKED